MPRKRLFGIYLDLLSTVLVISADIISIYQSRPGNGAQYFIKANQSLSIDVEYDLFGISGSLDRYQYCFDVFSLHSATYFIDFTCLSISHKTFQLSNLQQEGEYKFTAIIKDNDLTIDASKITTFFQVYSYKNAIPSIHLLPATSVTTDPTGPHRITLAANRLTSEATFSLAYQLQQPQLLQVNLASFTVCGMLEKKQQQQPQQSQQQLQQYDHNDNDVYDQLVLSWTCLAPSDRSLILQRLTLGDYRLTLRLRDLSSLPTSIGAATGAVTAAGAITTIASSEVQSFVSVRPLAGDILPTVHLPELYQEYGIDLGDESSSRGKRTATVRLSYSLEGLPTAIEQMKIICVDLTMVEQSTAAAATDDQQQQQLSSESTSANDNGKKDKNMKKGTIITSTCLPIQATTTLLSQLQTVSLTNIPIGDYEASFTITFLHPPGQPDEPGEQSTVLMKIIIQPMEEFIPSYIWQPLHAWHTIPAGIETRLPIGDGTVAGTDTYTGSNKLIKPRKEARISDPWRLQLPLPASIVKECKLYFLRMDIYRHTQLREIYQQVSDQCLSKLHHHQHHTASDTSAETTIAAAVTTAFASECFTMKLWDAQQQDQDGEEGGRLLPRNEEQDQQTAEDLNLFNLRKEIVWLGDSDSNSSKCKSI